MVGIVERGIDRVRKKAAVFSILGGRRRTLFFSPCPCHGHDVRWATLFAVHRLWILLEFETRGSYLPGAIFALDTGVEDEGAR